MSSNFGDDCEYTKKCESSYYEGSILYDLKIVDFTVMRERPEMKISD